MKKFILVAICAAMLLSAAAPAVYAVKGEAYGYAQLSDSGSCGENTTWTLSDEGELVISGEGEITKSWSGSKSIRNVTIGSGVTGIPSAAFEGCEGLESVTIADTVSSIGSNAFMRCRDLKNVVLPNGIEEIPDGMFYGCLNLAGAELPDTVKRIGNSAFTNCFGLESIVLPDAVEEISNEAFSGSGISGIVLSRNLTRIGFRAFYGCGSLREISIPANVAEIGRDAFGSLPSLEKVEAAVENESYSSDGGVLFNKDKTVLIRYPSSMQGTEYNIPDGTEIIDRGSFADCKNLESVNIPASVYEVGNEAFSECKALKAINVSEEGDWMLSIDGVLFSEEGARLCAYPAGKIDESYTVPDDTITVGERAFAGNEHLTSVSIPDSVYSIENGAFMDCTALKEARISAAISEIPSTAFYSCTALESIYLPGTLKRVANYAFSFCESLKDIFFNGTEEEWDRVNIESKELDTGNYFFANAEVHFTGYTPVTVTTIKNIKEATDERWNFTVELGKYYDLSYVTAASYTKDGALIATNRSELSTDRIAQVSIPKTDDAYYIKLYAWNSDMQPVADSEVVMVTGNITVPSSSAYSADSFWAVYKGSRSDEGELCADVLVNGWSQSIPVENAAILDGLSAGDIFFFLLNEDHKISEIKPVTKASAMPDTYRELFSAWLNGGEEALLDSETAAQFAAETQNRWKCALIAGPIVNIENMNITVNGVSQKSPYLYIASGEEFARSGQSITSFEVDRVHGYDLSPDVNICIYDYMMLRAKDRPMSAYVSSIKRSLFDRAAYVGDKHDNVINFEAELNSEKEKSDNANYGNVNFAIAKVVDNEITEILLIVPDDKM